MDATDIMPYIEELEQNIDKLQKALTPLTKDLVTQTACRLPLLDRAKLYVLLAYSIESMIFC